MGGFFVPFIKYPQFCKVNTTPQTIVVMGLPGSGKSYFASRFASRIGGQYLSSDLIREELLHRGQYAIEVKETVYREMENRMEAALLKGKSVVLDATFFKKRLRDRFAQVAREAGSSMIWIMVVADEETTRRRVSKPREHSDADWDVFLLVKEAFEPFDGEVLTLSSDDENVERMIREGLAYCGINQTES